jgi:hypothetical protein
MALNNVPLAGQTLAVTRDPIRTNFNTIDTAFSVDHVAYNTLGQGKHNKVTLPVQAVPPTALTTEVALFSRDSIFTGKPELFMRNGDNGFIYAFTDGLQATPGWSYLPSGILLKWGQSTANGLTTFTYPTSGTIPAFQAVFAVLITTGYTQNSDNPNGFVRLNTIGSPTAFTVWGSPRTTTGAQSVDYTYLAIGA